MKRINGILYYSLRETAITIGRDYQTILRYFKVSKELRMQGKEGLLPDAIIVGKGHHYFSESDVRIIREKARRFKRGTFKNFSEKKTSYQKLKDENETLKNKIKKLEMGVR